MSIKEMLNQMWGPGAAAQDRLLDKFGIHDRWDPQAIQSEWIAGGLSEPNRTKRSVFG